MRSSHDPGHERSTGADAQAGWLDATRSFLDAWAPMGDPLAHAEQVTKISRDAAAPEDRDYLLRQAEALHKNRERCLVRLAEVLAAHPEPERYVRALRRIVDAERAWVREPWDLLMVLAGWVRDAGTAEVVAVAAQRWASRFPPVPVPHPRRATSMVPAERRFSQSLDPLVRGPQGTVLPIDRFSKDLPGSLEGLEELYALSKTTSLVRFSVEGVLPYIESGVLPLYVALARDLIRNHPDFAGRALELLDRYADNHEITRDVFVAFHDRIPEALRSHDPDLAMLRQPGNYFGMQRGQSGVADFLLDCYVQPVTSRGLALLMLDAESVPALDAATRSANVRDGVALMCFGPLRDQIHDQMPGVHGFVAAMVDYFEDPARGRGHLEGLARTSPSYFADRHDETFESLFDLSVYASEVPVAYADGAVHMEPAINVLRRVKNNTERTFEEPPPVPFADLRGTVERISASFRGASVVPRGETLEVLHRVNAELERRMGDPDARERPSDVRFLVWVDQLCFRVLQTYAFEDQLGALSSPLFKEVVRFHDLTHNPGAYDAAEFETWYASLALVASPVGGGGWGLPKDPLVGLKGVAKRIHGQVGGLADELSRLGRGRQAGLLWSGNSSDQLIGLVDPRPAATKMGDRRRREVLRRSYFG